MNNAFLIRPEKFEEDLQDLDLHFIGNFSAEFLSIPPMVETFWEMLHYNAEESWEDNEPSRIIPTQDEFTDKYLHEHKGAFENLSDNRREGVRARVLKAYPSLVRESHFTSQVQKIAAQSSIPSTLLIANSRLDLGSGVDLAIQLNGCSFALKITKTDSQVDWEKIKEERKSDISVPHPITVIANENNTFEVGKGQKLFLFREDVTKEVLMKCLEVSKGAEV